MQVQITTTITRSQYGEILGNGPEFIAARKMVRVAEEKGKIPASFDDMSWGTSGRERGHRIGFARFSEIYDFTASAVLVCSREVEGTKYGQKTTSKTYFLIRRHGAGLRVTEASKALAAKAAKASGSTLGEAIAVVLGKKSYTAPANAEKRLGYKVVAQSGEGLESVFDGSSWEIGKTRTERATPDHEGGYYYYADIETAVENTAKNVTFKEAWRAGKRLVVVEVEASGRHFRHDSGKLCASRVKPLREVAALI